MPARLRSFDHPANRARPQTMSVSELLGQVEPLEMPVQLAAGWPVVAPEPVERPVQPPEAAEERLCKQRGQARLRMRVN